MYKQVETDKKDLIVKGCKSQEILLFTEEDMIEFAEWIANSKLHGYCKQLYEAMIIYKVSTTKEILQIWKEQKKILPETNVEDNFTKDDLFEAFSYYAFTSISNQPYNNEELLEEFEKCVKNIIKNKIN